MAERTVKGTAVTLAAIFRDPGGFQIPLFQRGYSWDDKHVGRLLTDLWEAHGTLTPRKVFLGSIVTQREGDHGPFNLIDGQQRWTTINLVSLALKEMFVLGKDTAAAENFDHRLKAKVDPDNVRCQDFKPMLAVGRTTNSLFADLVTKGTLFEAIDSIPRCSIAEAEKRRLLIALRMCLDMFVGKVLHKCPEFAIKVQHYSKTQDAVSYMQLKRYAGRQSTPDISISYAEEVSSELQPGLDVLNNFDMDMLKNTYILWAETYDLSWAFHVFKSMNETGLELTDIDKLKALVVACWAMESKAQETHADQWDQCIADAGGEKKFRHVLHMMAYANGMRHNTGLLQYMENSYCLGGRKPLLFEDKPNNARKFMEHLAATCKYYKAITAQGPDQAHKLFPTLLCRPIATAQQEWQVSRLFCSLALMESGVHAQQSIAQKDGSKKDEKSAYHIMPALVFLNMYPTVSKLKDEGRMAVHPNGYMIDDALRFLTALEKRAAFDLITKSAHKTIPDLAADTTELSQKSAPKLHFSKYMAVVKALQNKEKLEVALSILELNHEEHILFARQLCLVARNPSSCKLPVEVYQQIVEFLVKRHELLMSMSSGSLRPHQVEHICPKKPKKGCWQWGHEDFVQLLWSLGNLTLLEPGTNGSVGNKEYWEKCHKFFTRAKGFVGASIVFYPQCEKGTLWTAQQCSDRGEGMLREMCRCYGLTLVEVTAADDEVAQAQGEELDSVDAEVTQHVEDPDVDMAVEMAALEDEVERAIATSADPLPYKAGERQGDDPGAAEGSQHKEAGSTDPAAALDNGSAAAGNVLAKEQGKTAGGQASAVKETAGTISDTGQGKPVGSKGAAAKGAAVKGVIAKGAAVKGATAKDAVVKGANAKGAAVPSAADDSALGQVKAVGGKASAAKVASDKQPAKRAAKQAPKKAVLTSAQPASHAVAAVAKPSAGKQSAVSKTPAIASPVAVLPADELEPATVAASTSPPAALQPDVDRGEGRIKQSSSKADSADVQAATAAAGRQYRQPDGRSNKRKILDGLTEDNLARSLYAERNVGQAKITYPDRKGQWRKLAEQGFDKLNDEEKQPWYSKAAVAAERSNQKQKALADSQSQAK